MRAVCLVAASLVCSGGTFSLTYGLKEILPKWTYTPVVAESTREGRTGGSYRCPSYNIQPRCDRILKEPVNGEIQMPIRYAKGDILG